MRKLINLNLETGEVLRGETVLMSVSELTNLMRQAFLTNQINPSEQSRAFVNDLKNIACMESELDLIFGNG